MKKDNLATLAIVTLLATCTIALYVTKIESIILGVDIPSYFIFASMMIISALLLLNKEDIYDIFKMATRKEYNKNEMPNKIYNFCKHYYFDTEETVTEYLKTEVKNKRLANFLVRYVDKNTKEEIQEYISAQESMSSKSFDNARKVVYYSNIFVFISVIASYIYDSNIKGILLIAGALCLSNLFVYRKVETNIAQSREELVLFKNIYEDILNFKNAKYVMYKCKSLLAIDEDFLTIDDLTITENVKENKEEEKVEKKKEKPINYDLNIEERRSALITIGKNKKASDIEHSIKKEMRM